MNDLKVVLKKGQDNILKIVAKDRHEEWQKTSLNIDKYIRPDWER